jgi:hypothetical protein
VTLAAVAALGFFLGVRHATDVDHVVAVTTIICRERTPRGAMMVGAVWGIGHTVTILMVGGAIILFGLVIPPRVGVAMELAVGVMLMVLGAMNLAGATRRIHAGAHAGAPAAGAASAAGEGSRVAAGARAGRGRPRLMTVFRPLLIGVVHGLAGSAAIALLVLATIRGTARALLYLGVFGAGTIAGMMLLTTAMTLPIAAASRRFGSVERLMARVTGVISLAFGIFLLYRHGLAPSG